MDKTPTTRTEPPPELGEIIARHRHRLGLSIRRAAERIGIDPGYLCHLEHGTRCPSIIVAEDLAYYLEITGTDRTEVLAAGIDGVGRDRPENAYSARGGQSDTEHAGDAHRPI